MRSVNRDFLIYVFYVKYKQRKLRRDVTAVFYTVLRANGFGKVPTTQIIYLHYRGNDTTEALFHS